MPVFRLQNYAASSPSRRITLVMKFIVVSPHRDDAAFSCGILIRRCVEESIPVEILNLFTESEYAPFAPTSLSPEVCELRHQEDNRFQQMAGDSLVITNLNLLDAPKRLGITISDTLEDTISTGQFEQEVAGLALLACGHFTSADCVCLPLALGGHIDHRIARYAVMRCVPLARAAFYEDLPYAARVAKPQKDRAIASFLSSNYDRLLPTRVRHNDAATIKHAYATCYRSQIDAETMREIAAYTALLGGECFYAGEDARALLGRTFERTAEEVAAQ